MKSKFTYLYLSFIISLAILVILSFLFYKRLNTHLLYSAQLDNSYSIIIELNQVEKRMLECENYSRGFMLIRDTAFIGLFNASKDSIPPHMNRLKFLLWHKDDQISRYLRMKSTITNQLNIYTRNIQRAGINDETTTTVAVVNGSMLMDTFRLEAMQIQNAELKMRNELFNTKQFYADIYPNYFNTLTIFAGVLTLVSFFFINREVRMRTGYQRELENKLLELHRSNSELGQFAYIASHDLQEPLRKIRTFSDKLLFKHRNELKGETQMVVDRIVSSATRMQELIQDMTNFTSLINREDVMVPVDLNDVVTNVLKEYVEQSSRRHAIITWETLPVINGNKAQLFLLFKSLIDNSFKFARPGLSPEIRITYKLADGLLSEDKHLKGRTYHKIVMEDKGIGFSNEFAEKIFMIFQRLHPQQSGNRGKGMGLALAQRVMTNHDGIIMARGVPDEGASFIMYFPLK